ncbi:MAG: hypothetical protein LBE23_13720 [Vagococcus sp.]|jgi:hypothetical protein|nr:hypothetical protein [Vagococcus sp.]
MKIVAVVNDNTGEIHSVLEKHINHFPHQSYLVADSIEVINKFGEYQEDVEVEIKAIDKYRNFIHIVDSRKYSFIYEDD